MYGDDGDKHGENNNGVGGYGGRDDDGDDDGGEGDGGEGDGDLFVFSNRAVLLFNFLIYTSWSAIF